MGLNANAVDALYCINKIMHELLNMTVKLKLRDRLPWTNENNIYCKRAPIYIRQKHAEEEKHQFGEPPI